MMNRRHFLKSCSFLGLATVARAGRPGAETRPAGDAVVPAFSLHLITADPERVLAETESLLARTCHDTASFTFAEYPLSGRHRADVVLIQNGRLVDFRSSRETLAQELNALARRLGLPKPVENPVMLKFSSADAGVRPRVVNVFAGNRLMQQLSLTGDQGTHQIESDRGEISLVVRNNSVKILAASCRHQTCMKMGTINAAGQHLVCIPSQIRITLEGRHAAGIDGISG